MVAIRLQKLPNFMRMRVGREAAPPGVDSMDHIGVDQRKPKFEIGQIVITPAASAALEASGYTLAQLLSRHQAGDWGDVSDHERTVNERGLAEQFNLQSAYAVLRGSRLVVVTNGARTLTMVHLDHCGA
jgi:hypothetical protein